MQLKNVGSRVRGVVVIALTWLALAAQTAPEVQQKVTALERQVQIHLQQQKPQLAIPVLREIVSLDPANLNAQGNLGVLLFFDGKYAEAIPHMREALRLKADLWRIAALLGIAEKRTGDMTEARSHLEQAFSNLDDKSVADRSQRTHLSVRSGDGSRDRLGMDIESKKAYLRHATNSFRMRLCAAVFTDSQRNPRYCESGLVATY